MRQGMRHTVLWALVGMGMAWAGGSGSNTSASQGANGSSASVSASSQGGQATNLGSDAKGKAIQRKQARAARHAAIDKARQQALDSLRATFAAREAGEVGGSSESVNEKLLQEKATKQGGK